MTLLEFLRKISYLQQTGQPVPEEDLELANQITSDMTNQAIKELCKPRYVKILNKEE